MRISLGRAHAALWALQARRVVWRALLAGRDVKDVVVPRAPSVGLVGTSAVGRVLRATKSTCLVEASLMQEWFASQGEVYDLIIGATSPRDGFTAHAWLERPGETTRDDYKVLRRLTSRA